MNILLIEDNLSKYLNIMEGLESNLDEVKVTWKKSRNTGLNAVIEHNIRGGEEPFDLVIVDNYLPIYEYSMKLKPYAKSIIDIIRESGLKDLKIIVCSSEEVEECDYNYKIDYSPNKSMKDEFKNIFNKMNDSKTKNLSIK